MRRSREARRWAREPSLTPSGNGSRPLVAAVPWGLVGVAAVGLVVPALGVVVGQALVFGRRFVVPPTPALVDVTVVPSTEAVRSAATVVEIAAFGDSAMAGVGVHHLEETLPVQLACRVAESVGRPVHVVGYARSGARTIDVLTEQVPLVRHVPDVSVLVVGTNDVTGVTLPARLARASRALLDALESLGSSVVMSTLPRFRSMRRLPHPLMEVVSGYGAVVGAVQRRAAAMRPRVRLVDVGGALGPEYFADVSTLSADAFHPSAAGYGRIADALVPAVLAFLESA